MPADIVTKPRLRAVSADEKPKRPATPKSITDALDGTPRDVLAAMRRALAQKLDAGEVSSNAIASAYKELRELDRLIRQHDAAAEAEGGADDDEYVDTPFDASSL